MGHVSFHIRQEPSRGEWVVEEEEDAREIRGVFSTLTAALDFVDQSRRPQLERAGLRKPSRARGMHGSNA
jgi:hypothetical protein